MCHLPQCHGFQLKSGCLRAAARRHGHGVCGAVYSACPWAVSTWLCSGAFPWGCCVFFLADCPGMVGNVKSTCAWGSRRQGPRSTGDLRELSGLFSVTARRAVCCLGSVCHVNAVLSASRSQCRTPELPRTRMRTPPSARSVATVTGRTACSSATAVMLGKCEVLPPGLEKQVGGGLQGPVLERRAQFATCQRDFLQGFRPQ